MREGKTPSIPTQSLSLHSKIDRSRINEIHIEAHHATYLVILVLLSGGSPLSILVSWKFNSYKIPQEVREAVHDLALSKISYILLVSSG